MNTAMHFLKASKGFSKRAGYVGKFCLLLILSSFALAGPAHAERSSPRCDHFFGGEPYRHYQNSGLSRKSVTPLKTLDDGSSITLIDLSLRDSLSALAKRSIRSYELMQQGVYTERLDKFKEDKPEKTSKKLEKAENELKTRSKFILNTTTPLSKQQPEFRGGARVVFSRDAREKLPFELDLKVDRPYPKLPAAEVGRLTVVDSGLQRSEYITRTVDIIRSCLEVIERNPDIEVIFVHTSRVHVRLYKLMGLIPEDVQSYDLLNQVMIFNREQLFDYLKPGALKSVNRTM